MSKSNLAVTLSAQELSLVAAILAIHASDLKIDWPRVSAQSMYSTPASATTNWRRIKTKLMFAAGAPNTPQTSKTKDVTAGGVDKHSPSKVANSSPKKATFPKSPKTPKGRGNRTKNVKAEPQDSDDPEMPFKVAEDVKSDPSPAQLVPDCPVSSACSSSTAKLLSLIASCESDFHVDAGSDM